MCLDCLLIYAGFCVCNLLLSFLVLCYFCCCFDDGCVVGSLRCFLVCFFVLLVLNVYTALYCDSFRVFILV